MAKELTQSVIDEWVENRDGWFTYRDIDYDLSITTASNKAKRRQYINRKVKEGEAISKNGRFRRVEKEIEEIHWQKADPKNVVPLKFPFGLEEYCRIFPKSIVVVAGAKEAGKTAFLYRFIIMNMNKFGVDLYNSETGPEQMKERFNGFDVPVPDPPPFRTFERYDNFADVIDPNRISVIDYLDLDSEVYLVGAEINYIFQKLNKGVAVIGLQKPLGRDLAYGGGFSAKRAILYLALDSNKLKIVYCKNPAQRGVNPNNMQWSFLFDDTGTNFLNIAQYFGG